MNKQKRKKVLWGYCAVWAIILLAFYGAIFVFDDETDENTYTDAGYISSLEYGSDHQKSWALFVLDGRKYYYQFYDKPNAKVSYAVLEQIQNNHVRVSVQYTKERDLLRMLLDFDGAYHVVSISDSNRTYFDIALHNREQATNRIICYVSGILLSFCTLLYWWLMEVFLSAKKPKEKRKVQR